MRKLALAGIMLICSIAHVLAQSRTITGKVTDEKGVPVAAASVVIKSTNNGVVTDADGRFSLTVGASDKTLVISSLNFEPLELAIDSRTSYTIQLKESVSSLDEVVVVGYQQISKANVAGAVAKVSGAEVANRPVMSFDQALTGKAAGVQVNTSSGLVGDNVIIRVRGASSISSGSQPLIVVDGVPISQGNDGQLYNPVNTLADINPNDIESVEVLKDASAAAIYGSRASAGVLLITTKKGKAGAGTLTYDGYVGVNKASRQLKVLNGDQYNTVINKMRSNAGLTSIAAHGDYNGDGQADVVNTDWQKEVYRNGMTQNHQVAISGGAGKTTYYGSLGYNDFQNYIIVNRQKRISGRLNLTAKPTTWFETGIKMQYSQTTSYGLGSGTGGALSGVPFGPLTAYPNIPIHNEDGSYYTGAGGNSPLNNTPNPVAVQELNFDTRDSRRLIGSVYGEAQLIKGLKFKSQFNIDQLSGYTDQYWDPSVGDGSGLAGLGQTVSNEKRVWSWTNTLNYVAKFNDHDINALAGAEYTRNRGMFYYAFGVSINDLLFRLIDPANYASTGVQNGNTENNGLASYFGGVNYGYKNKYIASFNVRADAYSGFGRDNRWGYFPSGALAWRISQEDFMQSIAIIRELKLRASYGITGNSNIGDFPALATFAPTQYADLPSLNLNNPGNSSLKWERTGQLDVGFDLTLRKGLHISFDYYNKKTQDLILNNPVLATLGFPGNIITENIGRLKNEGVELSLNIPVFNKKDFTWDADFNIAWNKNKVLATNDNGDDIPGGNSLVRPGHNMSSYFLIRWAGVNPANGLPTFLDVNGVRKQYDHSLPAANRWTLVSDGSITTAISAADRVLDDKKTPYPKLFGGLAQHLRYKEFDMLVDLQYSLGAYVYNNTMQNLMVYTTNRNKSEYILNAWEKNGDATDVPRLFWGDNQSAQVSTRFLEKGDFLRIRNMQLGYSLPNTLTEKIKLSRIRVYVQVQNLWTFTSYKGIDPEANANGNVNIGLGIDSFRPYLPRTFTGGVNIQF
ncbi:MAG TPA: TonB-dependent receptor [Chitinophagaceae bacterium]|nr:TonB-dependent receptor [Chitinophagaceae bacterium]